MCYSPTRRSVQLIQHANESIEEGAIPAAERLLAAARQQMLTISSVVYNGKRVGTWYSEAEAKLREAKRVVVQR